MITCPMCGEKSQDEEWRKTERLFQYCHCMPFTRSALCPKCGKWVAFNRSIDEAELMQSHRQHSN